MFLIKESEGISIMTRVELKQQAKEQLKGNVGKFILILIVYFACAMVLAGITEALPEKAAIIGAILTLVLTPPLTMGYYIVFLNTTYGDTPKVADLFEGYKRLFGKSILLYILNAVFVFLWSLLLVVPGIIKAYGYSMAWYVMAENPDMSAREALKESERIMQGHKLDFFVLQLSFILWSLLVCVTFGLAAFYVAPYSQLTFTNFYHNVKAQGSTPVEDVSMDSVSADAPVYEEVVEDNQTL